jgi:hypothetical protein
MTKHASKCLSVTDLDFVLSCFDVYVQLDSMLVCVILPRQKEKVYVAFKLELSS